MNRKGDAGDWTNFGGFFIICFILGAGVTFGVIVFFGDGYDFRQAEAEVLFGVVENCFYENDFFVEGFNISDCGIDESVLVRDRLVLIENEEESYAIGKVSFEVECDLNAENVPYCLRDEIVKDGESYRVVIASGADSRRILS